MNIHILTLFFSIFFLSFILKFVGVSELITKSLMLLHVEKPKSFFDWELSFRRKSSQKEEPSKIKNSLGISVKEFKKFLKRWKKDNLQ